MAKPLKCDVCDKPATVHLTQIINNQIHKIDLCEACAEQKGITDPSGYSLADLLVKPDATAGVEVDAMVCPECGCSQRDFKKTGRVGCSVCYDTFDALVTPALVNMHRGDRHRGKVPQRALERKSFIERLSALESNLNDAIHSERYEDAARVRDEIIELKKAMAESAKEA
ncbi:UvrB/UvrC motif-containing protein [Pelagicoccus sp. SDUM812003]|uniref:UvrB/UvrC motif-containing protein n=1 Tax=Pelagicoccus sp. SDUM812003 TaxID=3041267 RepID=UPI002810063D|nr:UvrB/UvrC motif-containing protein [Pelagicoccus sp. SDUM812003]MDQ8202118.1 UvrB/UvrC motif-containing protein [Pelagicoccus sp. SDUM812003]